MFSLCKLGFSQGGSASPNCLLDQVVTCSCECGWLLKLDSFIIEWWHAQVEPTSLPMTEGIGYYCDNLWKWKSDGWKWPKMIKSEMISDQWTIWTIYEGYWNIRKVLQLTWHQEPVLKYFPVCSSVADLMLFYSECEFMFSNHWHVFGQSNVTAVQIFLICIAIDLLAVLYLLWIFVEIV